MVHIEVRATEDDLHTLQRALSERGYDRHDVLHRLGGVVSKDIWERLQEGGFRTGSRDPVRSVVAIAVRDPASFPKAGPNRYGLEGARAEAPEGGEAKA